MAVVIDPDGVAVELIDTAAAANLRATDERRGDRVRTARPTSPSSAPGSAGWPSPTASRRVGLRRRRDLRARRRASAARGGRTRYPGAACDVPSHLYSLSFAPNPLLVERPTRRSPRSSTTSRTATTASTSADKVRTGTTHRGRDVVRRRRPLAAARPGRRTSTRRGSSCRRSGMFNTPVDPGDHRPRRLRRAPCSTPPAGTTTTT